jgi:hypothetical protein
MRAGTFSSKYLGHTLAEARLWGIACHDSLPHMMQAIAGLLYSWVQTFGRKKRRDNVAFERWVFTALRDLTARHPGDNPYQEISASLATMKSSGIDSYAIDLTHTAQALTGRVAYHATATRRQDTVLATTAVLAALLRIQSQVSGRRNMQLSRTLAALIGLSGPRTPNEALLLLRD